MDEVSGDRKEPKGREERSRGVEEERMLRVWTGVLKSHLSDFILD